MLANAFDSGTFAGLIMSSCGWGDYFEGDRME